MTRKRRDLEELIEVNLVVAVLIDFPHEIGDLLLRGLLTYITKCKNE